MDNALYNIPDSWKWVTLDDIGIVVSGGTPSTKEPEYWNGDVPWITPADLSERVDVYISEGERNITQLGLDNSSAYLLPENSVVFSSRAPIGYVAIAKNALATNQGFKNLILLGNLVNAKYLYYYLKTVKEVAERMASGTTFLELSATKFKQIPFPLAPTNIQDKIVEKIEELFSELQYAKKNLEDALIKLDLQFQKTLKEYFSKYDGINYRLSEIAEWGSGGTPSRKNSSYFNGTIPWVKTQELKNKYINETQEYLTNEGLNNSSAKVYPKGSIVIAMYGATVGRLSILNIDACTNQACAVGVIKNSQLLNVEYLYYFLLVNKQNLISLAKGGAQQNISLSVIKDYVINLPLIDDQNTLVNDINLLNTEILNQKLYLEKELKRTKSLFEKILQEAFKGELVEVSEAESINVLLESLSKEKFKYLNEHSEKTKNKIVASKKKKDLLEVLKVDFKNVNFSFSDLINTNFMSIDDLELEFKDLISKGKIIKQYDEDSQSIKFKLT